MSTKKHSFLCSLLAALLVFAGCESDDSSVGSSITPRTATLNVGASVPFTLEGGQDSCQWVLSVPSAGRLSGVSGVSVIYTATKGGYTQTLSAVNPNGGAIIAQAYIHQPGSSSSNSGTTTTTQGGGGGSSTNPTNTSADTVPEGKLKWVSAPPARLLKGETATVQVSGESNVGKLVWSATTKEGNGSAVTFLTSSSGNNTVKIFGNASGSAIVVVEDKGAKGAKSSLSSTVSVYTNSVAQ